MMGTITIRRAATAVVLTIAWCGLWGAFSAANVLSGLLLSVAVIGLGTSVPERGGVNVPAFIRLHWLVFADLVRSTINVAVEVLTPKDHTQEAVVGVDLPDSGRNHLLFLVVAITLTPGTAVIDVDTENNRIYLHLLHKARMEETVAHTKRLADLACEAMPIRTSEAAEAAS
ncbi:MAG: Na+/H+ antiporter subunit E [Actinomycetota bacterium]